jgi:hypothetical protein
VGIIYDPAELRGFAAGTAAEPERHADDLRGRGREEPWAGLTEPGGPIRISLEQLNRGHDITELVAHEGMHEDLLSTTTFGTLLALLAENMTPPVPAELDLLRVRRLLDRGIRACYIAQEACATMAASILVRQADRRQYWERLPPAYRDMAAALRWIESRDLSDDQRMRLIKVIGHVALSVPVLTEWSPGRLSDLARWRDYLRDPACNPDARFRQLAEILARTPPGDIARELAAGQPESRFAERWLARADNAGILYAELDPPASWDSWIAALGAEIGASLDTRQAPSGHRGGYAVLPAPSRAVELKFVLTHTVWPSGFTPAPVMAELLRYRLAILTFNVLDVDVPSFRLPDGETVIEPDGMSVELKSPDGSGIACNLTAAQKLEYLNRADDDTTLVASVQGYDLARGDVEGVLQPTLGGRPHIVAMGPSTPGNLISSVLSGGLGGSRRVLWCQAPSRHRGAAYLLLRPADAPYPIVVCPVPEPTALAVGEALAGPWARRLAERVSDWSDLPADGLAGQVHVVRWMNTFERTPWPPECWAGGTRLLHSDLIQTAARRPGWTPGPAGFIEVGHYVETQGADAEAAFFYRSAIDSGNEELARHATIASGLLHLRLKQYDEAMACFRHDRLAGNEFLRSLGCVMAGRAAELAGRYDLAPSHYQDAARSPDPDHSAAGRLGLADCRAVLGHQVEAAELYRQVIKEGHLPHSQMAAIQLVKILHDSGLHDDAKKAKREALLAAATSGIGHRMSELLGKSRVVDVWWRDYLGTFPDALATWGDQEGLCQMMTAARRSNCTSSRRHWARPGTTGKPWSWRRRPSLTALGASPRTNPVTPPCS